MNADPAYPALTRLMGSCFHQDMDLEAETVPEAVALYTRGLSEADASALRAEIGDFLQKHSSDLEDAFLQRFAEDLDPRDVGLSIADFLRMIDRLIKDPAAFRSFLEDDLRAEFPQLRHLARACLDLPFVSPEARRLGLPGADSMPHAMSLHLRMLSQNDRQTLLSELQQFQDHYGDRATLVFGKRWLDLPTSLFGTFERFRHAVETIAADPANYRSFDAA
jgi:CdiI immunity protein